MLIEPYAIVITPLQPLQIKQFSFVHGQERLCCCCRLVSIRGEGQPIILKIHKQLYSLAHTRTHYMDYDRLNQVLPKQPSKWSIADVQSWLDFIGLAALAPSFQQASIDGSCLPCLTEDDLRNELQIKSSITVKKLMAWITIGLKQYQTHIQSTKQPLSNTINNNKSLIGGMMIPEPEIATNQHKRIQPAISNPSMAGNYSKSSKGLFPTLNRQQKSLNMFMPNNNEQFGTLEKAQNQYPHPAPSENTLVRKQRNELILQPYQKSKTSPFSLKEAGGKIGRHNSNNLLIVDQSISRHHAQIQYEDGQYYLRDVGSSTGTFLKIQSPTIIQQGNLIEIGSNTLYITQANKHTLHITILEGPNAGLQLTLELENGEKISIGRKNSNNVCLSQDQHLSNTHIFLYSDGRNCILEDNNTTNGTWLRLSSEGEKSDRYLLTDGTVIKLGTEIYYSCRKQTAEIIEKISPTVCNECKKGDRDCVYMPCKHNHACFECSQKYKACPVCFIRITDYIKIFKS